MNVDAMRVREVREGAVNAARAGRMPPPQGLDYSANTPLTIANLLMLVSVEPATYTR